MDGGVRMVECVWMVWYVGGECDGRRWREGDGVGIWCYETVRL